MDQRTKTPPLDPLLILVGSFLLIGGPLALFMWREVRELLMGRINAVPLLVAVLLLVVLVAVSRWFGRRLQRYGVENRQGEGERDE